MKMSLAFTYLDHLMAKTGKHAPDEVMILPLDLSQGEEHLKEAVQKAESCFGGAGVEYMFHNAAYERPVYEYVSCTINFSKIDYICK